MIVVTGATGNTGKPAVEALLAKGEKVRVIGRDAFKLEPFVKHGAEPFVGSVEDPSLLRKAFQGATAAYILIPPDMHTSEFRAYQDRLVDLYAAAIAETKIPYVVTLSSIGADQPQKTGPILGLPEPGSETERRPRSQRPPSAASRIHGESFHERTAAALDGRAARPSAGADAAHAMIACRDIGTYAAEKLRGRDFHHAPARYRNCSASVTSQ